MTADEATGEAAEGQSFIVDVTEVVVTHLDEAATKLVVEWWTPEHGIRLVERTEATDCAPCPARTRLTAGPT